LQAFYQERLAAGIKPEDGTADAGAHDGRDFVT